MKSDGGFTAVELLITIIIGTIMLLTGYQLYTFVLNDSANTRMQASASNVAYELLRENSANATNPCTPWGSSGNMTTSIPSSAYLPSGSTATVQITCPSGFPAALSYITSTITYGGNTVTHATYLSPN